MSFLRVCATLGLLIALGDALADGAASVEAVCARYKDLPFPAADRPGPEAAKTLVGCDAEMLYYGIGRIPDPTAARNCAFAQMDRGDDSVWGGAGILMMVYANGKGAQRNLDLAIKLACTIGGAPAEIEGRLQHLDTIRTAGIGHADFDLCDDITSGYMMGYCSAHVARVQQVSRSERLDRLTAKWAGGEKTSLRRLEKLADRYFEARVDYEVDASGTARAAMAISEDAALREDLLASLERFESGSLPRYSEPQFAAADARLNGVYTRVLSIPEFSHGTVTKGGIKATQRLWLKYRDAWVAFGKVKYPRVSATNWKAELTEKRIPMLEEFLDN